MIELAQAVRLLIIDAFAGQSLAPVVYMANQQAPKLEADFITIFLASGKDIGTPHSFFTTAGNDTNENVIRFEEWRISINCFSRAPGVGLKMARRISAYFQSQRGALLATEKKIGFTSVSEERDLTALVSGVWESRGQIDAVFNCTTADAFAVGGVDSVTINGILTALGGAETNPPASLTINTIPN